jgi:hypothetical protein
MVIKRVAPLSLGKIAGTLYAFLGLIMGGIFSLAAMAGAFGSSGSDGSLFGPMIGAVIGVGSIIFFPLLYGVLGFLMSMLFAWLYNIIAGMVGGIELEVQ